MNEREQRGVEPVIVTCPKPCNCDCHIVAADCGRCNVRIADIHSKAKFAETRNDSTWSRQEREFGKEIGRLASTVAALTARLAEVEKQRDEKEAELKCWEADHRVYGERFLADEKRISTLERVLGEAEEAASEYILALRQMLYAADYLVRKMAEKRADDLSSKWTAAIASIASLKPQEPGKRNAERT